MLIELWEVTKYYICMGEPCTRSVNVMPIRLKANQTNTNYHPTTESYILLFSNTKPYSTAISRFTNWK